MPGQPASASSNPARRSRLVADAGVPSTMTISPRPDSFANRCAAMLLARARSSEPTKHTRCPAVVRVMKLSNGMRAASKPDGVVHGGLVHRHEHRRVGALGDRAGDERDLLRHVVRPLRHIVQRRRAQPPRGAVGAEPRRLVGRVAAVLGEDGDPRRHHASVIASRVHTSQASSSRFGSCASSGAMKVIGRLNDSAVASCRALTSV